ncbi:MAG: glycosyltransferase, partial [Bacteroidales bacterium]|nr:glycosyltransferase [Bacteroidales bacterium]
MDNQQQPKTFLYCSSVSFGGLEMNVVRKVKWMKATGYHITLMLPKNSPIEEFATAEGLEVINIDINKKYFDVKNARAVARVLKQNKAELLLIEATRDVAFGSIVKRLFLPGIKLVYQSHMQIGIPKKSLVHTMRYRMYDKWIVSLPYLKEEVFK